MILSKYTPTEGSTNGDSTRLMTYSHDGYGLGHLRRTSDIAGCFVEDVPGSSVLMLIGCASGSVFPLPSGIDYIKIPSIIKVDTEVWHPRSLRIGSDQARALRASIVQKSADIFEPQLFLVDHVPAGVWGDLLPTLRLLKEREAGIVLGLRDILDSPEVTRAVWRQKNFYKLVETYYDELFIYGCRDVFDTASQYGLDRELGEKIRYCGYVCSEESHRTPEQIREKLRMRKDRLIVVTAGGGYDAYPLMEACLKAFRLLGKELPFEALFITGPLMEPLQRECLQTLASEVGVSVEVCVEDILSYMNAADLVITMAGYNSLSEILHLRKKALVIPRQGPSAEQTTRARLFSERGLIDAIFPDELSPRTLAERIMADLDRTDYPSPDPSIELCGGRRAAARLVELADPKAFSLPSRKARRHAHDNIDEFVTQ